MHLTAPYREVNICGTLVTHHYLKFGSYSVFQKFGEVMVSAADWHTTTLRCLGRLTNIVYRAKWSVCADVNHLTCLFRGSNPRELAPIEVHFLTFYKLVKIERRGN